jgi:uncharacterized membrane protein YedE/YeeE
MAATFVAFLAGLLFGVGLTLSRMIDPAQVLAFLDVAAIRHGGWNASLAVVMVAAVATTAAGYALTFRRRAPLLAATFALPRQRPVDRELVAGAVLFGVGWGLVGLCPGPALAGLGLGEAKILAFVAAMLAGMALYHVGLRRTTLAEAPR